MGQYAYEIMKEFGAISENKSRNTRKELNIISWNNRKPKLDIREWGGEDHSIVGKGITLTIEEYSALFRLFSDNEKDIIGILNPALLSDNNAE